MRCLTLLLLLCPVMSYAQDRIPLSRNAVLLSDGEKVGLEYRKKQLLEIAYDNITPFDDYFLTERNEQYGLIDKTGKYIIDPEYSSIEYAFNKGQYMVTKNSKTGLFLSSGKMLFPAEYDEITDFDFVRGMFVTSQNGKYAIWGRNGNAVVPEEKMEWSYNGGQIHVMTSQYHYVVDTAGNTIISKKRFIEDISDLTPKYVIHEEEKHYLHLSGEENYLYGYFPVSENLLMKQDELSIRDWFSLLGTKKYIGNEQVVIAGLIPDTNKVEKKLLPVYRMLISAIMQDEPQWTDSDLFGTGSGEPMKIAGKFTKETDLMSELPVTGISMEQAQKFTEYLTEYFQENQSISLDNTCKVTFRLPDEKEWILAAESGLPGDMRKNHVPDSVNTKQCMLFVFSDPPPCKNHSKYLKNSFGDGSTKVSAMNPDLNGIRQLFGNVSEMTTTEGIAKGGNFSLPATEAPATEQQHFRGPEPWLGVRLVAEILFE